MLKDLFEKSVLIFGCGNILTGDDGFGPAVIQRLKEHYRLPADVMAMDVGTSIRDILFDLVLSDKKPKRFLSSTRWNILIGSRERSSNPGGRDTGRETSDFSLHQFPTVNMLQELKEHSRIEVKILVAQVEYIPEEVNPGLSPVMTGPST